MTVITEPAPTGRVFHSGRGGAGNYHRLDTSAPLAAPPTSIHTAPPARFFGGRGGAGNVKPSTERAMFSFDEELERDRLFHEHHAPVYSVGRGGAGNIVPADAISTRSHYNSSTASSPRSSTSSERIRSGADNLLNRLSKIRSNSSQ